MPTPDPKPRVPAVIMAGGEAKPAMVAATGVRNRALIPVGGGTMLSRVVEALRASGRVEQIVVAGSVPEGDYARVPDGGGFVANLFAGLEATGSAPHVLVATCDIPFLTGEAIADMVERGMALDADLVYPIVPVSECQRRFPEMRRTSLRLRDGTFTGGNVMLVRPAFMEAHRERIAQAYAARKSPLRLGLMVGPGTIARLLAGAVGFRSVLGVPELEQAISRLLGGTARALRTDYAEIAADVDRPSDLEALKALA